MIKDYAKQFYKQPPKKRGNRKWILPTLIVVIVLVCIGIYIKIWVSPLLANNPQVTALFSRLKTIVVKKPVATNQQKSPTTVEEVVHFSFYNELPKRQISASPEEQNKDLDTSQAAPPPVLNTPETEAAAPPVENQQVVEETKKTENEKTTTTVPPEPAQVYVLQFGIFKELAGAAQLRLSLLLTGIETEVMKIQTEHQLIYRVQQGPYSNFAQAKLARQKSVKKGIESVIKKI